MCVWNCANVNSHFCPCLGVRRPREGRPGRTLVQERQASGTDPSVPSGRLTAQMTLQVFVLFAFFCSVFHFSTVSG